MQFGASFCYLGEPVFLEPAHMVGKTKSLYQYDFPDGLVVLYEVTKIPSQDAEGEEACLALLRFENKGRENTGQIFQAKTMDTTLRKKEGSQVLFHGLQGDSCGSASFLPLDFPLPEKYHMEPVGGRSSNTSAFPFFDLACGEKSWLFAVGWTGQWCGDLEVEEDSIRIRIGMCDSDFYLEPGEAVRLPAVLVLEGGRPDAFALRSAATQGVACNFDLLSPDFDFVLARKALGEVAALRQFWEEGSFYPLTVPTVREDVWAAWQLAGDGRGCAVFFRREQCLWEEQRFCLRELDPMARYQVCLRDEDFQETHLELEGREFLAGIKIRIPKPRASIVLTYLRRQERE